MQTRKESQANMKSMNSIQKYRIRGYPVLLIALTALLYSVCGWRKDRYMVQAPYSTADSGILALSQMR